MVFKKWFDTLLKGFEGVSCIYSILTAENYLVVESVTKTLNILIPIMVVIAILLVKFGREEN